MSNIPLGVRLNNPGNLEWGDPWQGLVPRASSRYANSGNAQQKRFCEFTKAVYGIRAIARTLITYQDKYGIRTVQAAISRWAPSNENDTRSYVSQVRKAVGGDIIDVHSYASLRPLVEAIIRHENGVGPLKNLNEWYDDATIEEALRMAGVRKAGDGKVPMTKETIGATAAGVSGVGQLVEVMPQVTEAITKADAHLSSGSWVRISLGLVTIGIAVFIAYSQVKRKQTGEL